MSKVFDIEIIMSKLKDRRKVFVSEADFQLELAWIIKEKYPEYKVRLEYCPYFDKKMHIDILVISNYGWIPIELKYKTKGCTLISDEEQFELKNHGAKDVNCYLYLKDIQRIETIREKLKKSRTFFEGYTIFLTNELAYTKPSIKKDCVYKKFSLENGIIKNGILDWAANTSEGTKKGCEEAIELRDKYTIKWKEYSKVDDSNGGTFMCLVNEIKKT